MKMDEGHKNKILLSLGAVALMASAIAMLTPPGSFHEAMKLGVITCLLVLVVAVLYTWPRQKTEKPKKEK